MDKRLMAATALLSLLAFGCGGSSSSPTTPGSTTSVTGTWAGTASDSTTAGLGSGGMMGQAGMGTMTWQLTETGSAVTGSMSFAGMPSSMIRGTMSGTISGQDMTFTMDMPTGSMMSGACSAHAVGTMHVDGTTMTMTGTYTGTNSCAGTFNNGQMMMTRR